MNIHYRSCFCVWKDIKDRSSLYLVVFPFVKFTARLKPSQFGIDSIYNAP